MKQMKAMVLIFALALGLLSGCERAPAPTPKSTPESQAPALSMDRAEEINNVAHLLEMYQTVTYAQLDYIGGEVTHTTFFKEETGDIRQVSDGNGYAAWQTDNFLFSRWDGVNRYHIYAATDGFFSDYLLMGQNGKFVSQVTDGNGNLACETEADISQDYADGLSDWGVTTADKLLTRPVFAADDFRELAIDFIIRHPDGSEVKIVSAVLLYDREVAYPDAVQNYLDAKKYTVTVQMPGIDVQTAEIPAGESFTWGCDEGYALYLDAEGKAPLGETSDPVEGDMTLYCLQK